MTEHFYFTFNLKEKNVTITNLLFLKKERDCPLDNPLYQSECELIIQHPG